MAQQLCDPADLIPLMQAGDMVALERITRCFGERLTQVGRRYCRTETDAADAVQDALLAAGAGMRGFRGEGSMEGWLVRMVINACHHMRRGRKNDPRMHDAEAVLVSREGSPEERAITGELSQALGEALLELKPLDRTIVLLAEGEGWTGPEIAERLKLSPGAVRTRLTRARQRLRAHLDERVG